MPIPFVCPNCRKSFRAADKHAGKRAKCPGCGNTITIPLTAEGTLREQSQTAPPPNKPPATPPAANSGAASAKSAESDPPGGARQGRRPESNRSRKSNETASSGEERQRIRPPWDRSFRSLLDWTISEAADASDGIRLAESKRVQAMWIWLGLLMVGWAWLMNLVLVKFNFVLPFSFFGTHFGALFVIDDGAAIALQVRSLWAIGTGHGIIWGLIGLVMSVALLVLLLPVAVQIATPATMLAAWLFRLPPMRSAALLHDTGAMAWRAAYNERSNLLAQKSLPAWRRRLILYGVSAELWLMVYTFIVFFISYWTILVSDLKLESNELLTLSGLLIVLMSLVHSLTLSSLAAATTSVLFGSLEAFIKAALVRVGVNVERTFVDELILACVSTTVLRAFGLSGSAIFMLSLGLVLPYLWSKWALQNVRGLRRDQVSTRASDLVCVSLTVVCLFVVPWLYYEVTGGAFPSAPTARDVIEGSYSPEVIEEALLKHDHGPAPFRTAGIWQTNLGRLIIAADPEPLGYRDKETGGIDFELQLQVEFLQMEASPSRWVAFDSRLRKRFELAKYRDFELAMDGQSFTAKCRLGDDPDWRQWEGKRVIPESAEIDPPTAQGYLLQPGQRVQARVNGRWVEAEVKLETETWGLDVVLPGGEEERVAREDVRIDTAQANPIVGAATLPQDQTWIIPNAELAIAGGFRWVEGYYQRHELWYPCVIQSALPSDPSVEQNLELRLKGFNREFDAPLVRIRVPELTQVYQVGDQVQVKDYLGAHQWWQDAEVVGIGPSGFIQVRDRDDGDKRTRATTHDYSPYLVRPKP